MSNNEATDAEISIRGKGDKITVIAQNFAPGTTLSDIESVMAPDPSQSLVSKRLLAANPTVIAELVFGSRESAETVVARFNNKLVRLLDGIWIFEILTNGHDYRQTADYSMYTYNHLEVQRNNSIQIVVEVGEI
jgi:hypothetical protein